VRPAAYGLMALGAIVAAWSLVVLISHGLQSYLSHREGGWIVLLLVGVAIAYLGALVRRRASAVKDRQRTA
jgi:hypothetical protein